MRDLFVTLLGLFTLFSICLSVHVTDLEDASQEYDTFNVEVKEGKKLKLLFRHGQHILRNPKWYFNGRPIPRTRCTSNYGELLCPAVTRNDSGRYDLWIGDGTRHSQTRLMFSANVQVVKNADYDFSEVIPQRDTVQEVDTFSQDYEILNDCFCSGVTGRCTIATDLYRTRHKFKLSNAIPEKTLLLEGETATDYLKIPSFVWNGNLITAYGGYLRFPVTDECYIDRSKPCILLFDKRNRHRAIGFFLPPSHDQKQVQVLMKETNWRLVPAYYERGDRIPEDEINKFIFMSTLSHINDVYIRGRYRMPDENNVLTIDMATVYNDGLGKVTTVEDCACHPGYGGLSCERCNKGYIRVYESVNTDGMCLSISELWKLHKNKYSLE
ncbi:laminin subunit alpha-1-like [Anopheles funestus]|uniref:laminin subunit alpha-1-like n=1 Tax=Anopheles funestus TaxID=62324 RepID=UPI0020C6E7B4|nr:laminin subunit alpha-1-like [Anopheles funestus]